MIIILLNFSICRLRLCIQFISFYYIPNELNESNDHFQFTKEQLEIEFEYPSHMICDTLCNKNHWIFQHQHTAFVHHFFLKYIYTIFRKGLCDSRWICDHQEDITRFI